MKLIYLIGGDSILGFKTFKNNLHINAVHNEQCIYLKIKHTYIPTYIYMVMAMVVVILFIFVGIFFHNTIN